MKSDRLLSAVDFAVAPSVLLRSLHSPRAGTAGRRTPEAVEGPVAVHFIHFLVIISFIPTVLYNQSTAKAAAWPGRQPRQRQGADRAKQEQ